jgi:hypothetical protein
METLMISDANRVACPFDELAKSTMHTTFSCLRFGSAYARGYGVAKQRSDYSTRKPAFSRLRFIQPSSPVAAAPWAALKIRRLA